MNERGFITTINRQYGSGRRITEKKLSEEPGTSFYDQEILKMASEESVVGEQFFRLNDKKAGNNLICRAAGGLKSSLQEPSVEEGITSLENLFRFQAEIIRKVADESPCIIMGRCADYVPGAETKEQLVRLPIYADIPTCIRRIMEVDGADVREAPKRVSRISKKRRDYYKYYTGKDWEDMASYDLPINIIRLELDEAVTLIKDYIKIRRYEL